MPGENNGGRNNRAPEDTKKRIERRTVRRAVFIMACFLAVAVCVLAVLFKMQVVEYDE